MTITKSAAMALQVMGALITFSGGIATFGGMARDAIGTTLFGIFMLVFGIWMFWKGRQASQETSPKDNR